MSEASYFLPTEMEQNGTIAQQLLAVVAAMRKDGSFDKMSLCWSPAELEKLAMFAIAAKNKLAAPPPVPGETRAAALEEAAQVLDDRMERCGHHFNVRIGSIPPDATCVACLESARIAAAIRALASRPAAPAPRVPSTDAVEAMEKAAKIVDDRVGDAQADKYLSKNTTRMVVRYLEAAAADIRYAAEALVPPSPPPENGQG